MQYLNTSENATLYNVHSGAFQQNNSDMQVPTKNVQNQ